MLPLIRREGKSYRPRQSRADQVRLWLHCRADAGDVGDRRDTALPENSRPTAAAQVPAVPMAWSG